MGHIFVPEAEALLDKEIKVLDRGFIRLVDYMGGDARIVQTARVSYGAGTKTQREDASLIDYLMRHQHTSPFEHVVFEFHCKMPIFVARQWVHHRMARLNEISGRYSVMTDEFYLPPAAQIRRQAQDNKQGREAEEVPPELQQRVLDVLKRDQQSAYASYEEMLKDDVARELARINLPLSLYTQWYWQMDLHNLLHFLSLRMDPHAQWEIREYAGALAKIVKAVAPMTYASFERHSLHGCRLSSDEVAAVRKLLKGEPNPLSGRRLAEFEQKLFGEFSPLAGTPPVKPMAEPPHGEPAAPPPPPAATEMVHGLRVSMSRDEVNELPLRHYEGPIHVIRSDDEIPAMLEHLRMEKVIGFDTESRPAFLPGQSYPVAVIQFATSEAAYIVQVKPLTRLDRLFEIFSNPDVLKVGVAIEQDVRKLKSLHPFDAAGFQDVATIAERMGLKKSGLRSLAAIVLGFRVSKSSQRSNWAVEALSNAQVVYAATDAWVSRERYIGLKARSASAR